MKKNEKRKREIMKKKRENKMKIKTERYKINHKFKNGRKTKRRIRISNQKERMKEK